MSNYPTRVLGRFCRPICLIALALPAAASAQQVVTMPSLDQMIARAQNDGGAVAPNQSGRDSDSAQRAQERRDEAIARNEEREARRAQQQEQREREAQQRQAREEVRERHRMMIELVREQNRAQRRYKPLKRVRTLPPNASSY